MSINKFYVYTLALATFFILPVLAKAAVNIDACGFLNQAGETYILTQDVSSAGTCFSIGANNITLDLNGHTVTYNTSAGDLRHGIAIPSSSLQRRIYFPDPVIPDAAFVGADNIVIKNGTIIQGAGQGANSNAIFGWGTSYTEVANTHTTVYGADIGNIIFEYSNNLNIHDNIAVSNSTVVSNRHQGKEVIGSLGDGGGTKVYNNTISGGPQFGIRVASADGTVAVYEIYNNNISQNTKVVNGYGISASASGSLIHDNIINPINGRGIHIPGTDSVQVYNNTITVKEGPNPELTIGFSHGIKMENATNAKIYNNNVTALAGVDGSGHAYALDISQYSRLPGNNEIYNNTFTATTANSNRVAATVHLVGVSAGNNLNIHDNTFYTNDYAVYFDYDSGSDLVLRSNTFQLTGTPFTPQLAYFYTGSQTSLNNIFLDNVLGSGLSYDDVGYRSAGANFSLHIQEYLNVAVQTGQALGISGASVSVRDEANNLVASGSTNASGNLTLPITTYTHAGKPYQYSSFGPHSITVSANGYNTNTVSVDVSQIQDVLITMTAGDSSEPPACTPSWSCTAWSSCSSGNQSRTCSDANSCGDTSTRPSQSQSCTVDNGGDSGNQCTPSWSCTAWSSCTNSSQSRTCSDANSCGDNSSRPAQSQSCSVSNAPGGGGGGGAAVGNDTSQNSDQGVVNFPDRPNNSSLACRTCVHNRGSLLVLENANGSAVYHIGKDGRKYVFPDAKTYFTWNRDFSRVVRVSLSVLDDYPDGGVVAYRGGTKLITHQNTAKVYAVEPGGVIRWIPSEEIAKKLFGHNWAQMVQDVIPGFFATSYTLGEDLSDSLPTGTLVEYNGGYYYVDGNLKRKFTNLSALEANGFKVEDVMEVDDLSAYGNGADISGFDEEIASYL